MNQDNHSREKTDVVDFSEAEWTELDQELAQMALETPEMPADFHQAWKDKIRSENRQKESTKKENRGQWRYILSAAAVFLFLITGTILSRNDGDGNTNPFLKTETRQEVKAAGFAARDNAKKTEEAAVREAEETAWEADIAEPETEEANWEADMAVPETEEATLEADMAVPETEEEAEKAETAADGGVMLYASRTEIPAMMAAAYEAPAEADPDEETGEEAIPAAETKEAGEKSAGLGEETIAFMKDMGKFALSALPWVLGGAALAFLAAIIDRTFRERRKK